MKRTQAFSTNNQTAKPVNGKIAGPELGPKRITKRRRIEAVLIEVFHAHWRAVSEKINAGDDVADILSSMRPPCIFCDHDSGSPEHLWPDWMHNTVTFAPINMQEADGPIITGQDPEQTITTVCHDCNTGWMCLIENKASTRLKPMLLNQPIEIDRGGMKLLTQWAVLRAMDFESIKPKSGNEQFFTREERIAFKANQTIPERTRVWVGALENSHIGYHGTDYAIWRSATDCTRIGTGSVGTIYAGHIIMQTVTEHIHPAYVVQPGPVISPLPGPADERFVEIYPNQPKRVNWPTKPFTDDGPTGILAVRDRWHQGEKVSQIKNA